MVSQFHIFLTLVFCFCDFFSHPIRRKPAHDWQHPRGKQVSARTWPSVDPEREFAAGNLDRPLARHFRLKKLKKAMTPKSGKHPGPTWARFDAENDPRMHFYWSGAFLIDFERILDQFGVIFRDFQGSVTPKLLEIIVSGALGFFFNVFGTFQKERKMSWKNNSKIHHFWSKTGPLAASGAELFDFW